MLHVDAVQAAARMPVDFAALDVDAMTISAHKFGGPQGAGALIVKEPHLIEPMIRGGGQERNRRAGTENVQVLAHAEDAEKPPDRHAEHAHHEPVGRDREERPRLAHAAQVHAHQ